MSIAAIGPFCRGKDDWDSYIDRLDQYFIANDVKPAVKVATLITVIGSEAYELMVNLCTPDKPSARSYEDLVTLMKNHLQPRPSLLSERFKFRLRFQKEGETVANYLTELKKMSKDCRFTGDSLKENLRDQFVCGLLNDNIRQRLFTEDNVNLDTAYRTAVAIEAAERQTALVEVHKKRGSASGTETSLYSVVNEIKKEHRDKGANWRKSVDSHRTDDVGRVQEQQNNWRLRTGAVANMRKHNVGMTSFMSQQKDSIQCVVCGGQHEAKICKFRSYVCRVCNRKGHLKRVCPNLQRSSALFNMTEHSVGAVDSEESSSEVNNYSIVIPKLKHFAPYTVEISINNCNLTMEIDTGSAISCISKDCFEKFFATCNLSKSTLKLRYYTGEVVEPLGKFSPLVRYKQIEKFLDLYVIPNGKASLLGREWISELAMNFSFIACHSVFSKETKQFNLEEFSSRFSEVFADGLGRFTGGSVGFRLREGARPIFMRARPLAYALRAEVERELDRLVAEGIITPVATSDWATPIVPVMKKDGSIRICGDFKITLNKCLEIDRFPLPRVEDLLTKLHGGEKFTKIDLSQAYAQFELDESKKYTVINTHKGLFMYNRLIYGLSSSPGIFQRKLEQLFGNMSKVGVFLDDIIITGSNDEEHMATLNEVFRRLKEYGLKIRKDKCEFFAPSVTYLGFVISKHGVHTCPKKIEAIKKVPIPENVSQLRSLLGLVMYYAKFVPNISTILSPLYTLLRKDVKFEWNNDCNRALDRVKKLLISSEILAHYSPEQPLVLTTDASSVGVGAVISHLTSEGERPVAYASRSLNSTERAYSQIEREALAIIFGIKKFHQYLYGREFTLRTDHKPLVTIFGDKAGIPVMAASRMQRWAILLAGYNFKIEYVRSGSNAADALSRLPVGNAARETEQCSYINFIQKFFPIDRKAVKENLVKDEILNKVMLFLQTGWPNKCEDNDLRPYFIRKNELYLDMGCIVWGYRIVIPKTLRHYLLKELHVGHMGIVKMKSIARSVMWWPGIDTDIENTCKSCNTCAIEGAAPPHAPPQPWPYVKEPWSRLHVDFLGPFHGKTFLIIIDSTSKWLEIFDMQRTTASAVIKVLRETFARFGLPKEIVSDNGPPFTSQEYGDFMRNNGVKITFAPPYHPSSNGAAEGAVKLCKRAIKKSLRDGCHLDTALQAYLMAYRNVEHSTTGVSPAMLLQHRNLRSRLDLLRGDRQVEDKVRLSQNRQRQRGKGVLRSFDVGEKVWLRDYAGGNGQRWIEGEIKAKIGSRNFLINGKNGQSYKRHLDQIKPRTLNYHLPTSSGVATGSDSFVVPGPEVQEVQDEFLDAESSSPNSSIVAPVGVEAVSIRSSDSEGSPENLSRPNLRPRHTLKRPERYRLDDV